MMSQAVRSLGRGLGSLLPTSSTSGSADGTPLYVSVDRIAAREDQPRQHFDESSLRQLALSIREQGVLQPLVVTPQSGETYGLIAGERRLRAARLAGLREVPVIVRNGATPAEVFELALIENIQREDLNPIEEAEAFRRLIDEHRYTQEALAGRVGKDRTTIANSLRLLKLRPPLREQLLRGGMSAGHARALLGTDDAPFQDDVAARIERDGLSVRAVERLVAAHRQPKAPRRADPALVERQAFASRLQGRLGRKVTIRPRNSGRGGAITIPYTGKDDLRALVGLLAED